MSAAILTRCNPRPEHRMHTGFLILLRKLAPLFSDHHCLHSIGQVPEDPSLLSLNPASCSIVFDIVPIVLVWQACKVRISGDAIQQCMQQACRTQHCLSKRYKSGFCSCDIAGFVELQCSMQGCNVELSKTPWASNIWQHSKRDQPLPPTTPCPCIGTCSSQKSWMPL